MFWVYLIECETPGHIYVGQTSNVVRRYAQHLSGKGAKFTQKHGVKSLISTLKCDSREAALDLEKTMVNKLMIHPNVIASKGKIDPKKRTPRHYKNNLRGPYPTLKGTHA